MSGLAGWLGAGSPDTLDEMLALLGAGEVHREAPEQGAALGVVTSAPAGAHFATHVPEGMAAVRVALATDDDVTVTLEPKGVPVAAAIAAAYRADPVRFAARLSGRFAVAVWDDARQRLVLACDRSGGRTVFWTIAGGVLHFATSLKALLAVPGVARQLDVVALDEFLAQGFTDGTRTLVAGIHRLPPGHEVVHEGGGATVRAYGTPPGADDPAARAQVDQLGGLLADSVRARLACGTTAGCFLNGSVNSSVVLALLRESAPGRVQTFAVDWAGSDGDREAARKIAQAFGTDHHELEMTAPSCLDLIELTWLLDLPVSTPSVFATYLLSGLAREHVGRVFSGQGASQLFGRRATQSASGANPLAALRGLLARVRGTPLAARPADSGAEPPLFDAITRHGLYTADLRARLTRRVTQALDTADDDVSLGASGPLRGTKPHKLRRATRAQRVDLELPYLDPRLIDWAARLSPEAAPQQLVARGALRAVARRLLPEWVVERDGCKRSLPIDTWLRGPLSSFTAVLLGDSYVREQGLFDPTAVAALLARQRAGGAQVSAQLWRLMAFQLWFLIFIEDESRAREQISKARQTDRMPVKPGAPMPPVRL